VTLIPDRTDPRIAPRRTI